jgi:hypothetical protein
LSRVEVTRHARAPFNPRLIERIYAFFKNE